MAKSNGQKLVERIENYIGQYVELPADIAGGDGQRLVLALWALHTWVYKKFPATPYLSVTASVKEAGKTLCMEVLSKICLGPHILATLRPLALLRVIKAFDGNVTLFVDEAEKLSSGAVGDLRSIFTTGYSQGGKHVISSGVSDFVSFDTFSPKCFALIGDVMDVVHSRSIVIRLERAEPRGDFRGADSFDAQIEAAEICGEIRTVFEGLAGLPLVQPRHLKGRELEIWAALFSVASGLGLDGAMMRRLEAASVDLVDLKHNAPKRVHYSAEDEATAALGMVAERALRDLAAVMGEAEPFVFSSVAVERMKGIPTGPWRTFRGVGLNEVSLSELLRQHGVTPQNNRMARGKGASKAVKGSGYMRALVLSKVPGSV